MKKRVVPDRVPSYLNQGVSWMFIIWAIIVAIVTFGISFFLPIIHFIHYIFVGKKNLIFNEYCRAISRAYRWSIRAALETNYPEGIIYILNNTLAQLQVVGINYQPAKQSSYGDTIGYPDQTKLRNAIKMAEEVRQQWGDITRLGGVAAQIQAMENIKNMIRSEDVWMYGMRESMKVNLGKELYWFSYPDEDHQAISELNNNTISPPPPIVEPKPPVNNPPSPPPQRVLTFKEFLQQHPGLLYLSEPEQEEEYKKYLVSKGVKASEFYKYLPSMKGKPPSSPDNSNYGTGNKEDNSVW